MPAILSVEHEQILQAAVASGWCQDEQEALSVALRLLHEQTAGDNGLQQSSVEWKRKLSDHLARLPMTSAKVVDDTRESIYGNRGE